MENQDEYVKTALRLTRALHDELKSTAERAGTSMNAEILARLHASREAAAASQILAWLENFEASQNDTQRRRDEVLWRIIDRADQLLARLEDVISTGVPPDQAADSLRELGFMRELIDLAKVNR